MKDKYSYKLGFPPGKASKDNLRKFVVVFTPWIVWHRLRTEEELFEYDQKASFADTH